MGIKEHRKKLERSIEWMVAHYPAKVVEPELGKLAASLEKKIMGMHTAAPTGADTGDQGKSLGTF
jgi:hypothetical protein